MDKIELPQDANASGRNFGTEELTFLKEVIDSGTLNCTFGTQVKEFEKEFGKFYGASHVRAVTSGTAACHSAYSALNLAPGTEVITTPITDMGAIAPILYQKLIPVFADVDPITLNITAKSVEKMITKKTGAIIATHLFGNPCDIIGILEVAKKHNLPVIEDAAQSYMAKVNGKLTGTFGAIGCFSMQQGKHMTCGEGGIVITEDDSLGKNIRLFSDKAWGYGDPNPDHYFLALNYRMTELQGAVARAQLKKLSWCVQKRQESALLMHRLLADIDSLILPIPKKNCTHTYWKYPIIVDSKKIEGGAVALGKILQEKGIICAPRYIQKPAFECQVIREELSVDSNDYPNTYKGLANILVLPWNEKYTTQHVEYLANNIVEAVLCKK